MPRNHILIDGSEITGETEIEQLLDSLQIPPHQVSPNPDRNYAAVSDVFIRRLGETANASDPEKYLERFADDADSNQYLTFRVRDAYLEIQYFEEGCAMIGYCNTFYGSVYYFVNPLPERRMLCCNGSLLKDIIFHFCKTRHKAPICTWVEDFSYTGPKNWHRDWLKGILSGHFTLEERNPELIKLRAAQRTGKWQWGQPWPWLEVHQGQIHWENPDEMDELARLASTKPPASKELTKQEKRLRRTARKLQKAEAFTQRESGVRNLSFLQNCQHLRTLDLRCNDVEDLTPIALLKDLRELTLDHNLIADLSPLSELIQLRELSLCGNQISSLEPLQNLKNLKDLNLRGNPLAPNALSFLRPCKRLDMLNLSYTGIGDISGLENCRASCLTLYGNPDLTGLEVITTMKKLTSLSVDWDIARRYDIPSLMPRFTEQARYGNHVLYVWPEKYFG